MQLPRAEAGSLWDDIACGVKLGGLPASGKKENGTGCCRFHNVLALL